MKHLHENKRNIVRKIALALVCTVVLVPLFVGSPARVTADVTTDSLKEKIKNAQDEQDRIKSEIDSLSGEASESYDRKRLYDELAAKTQEKIYLSEQLIEQLSNQALDTESEIARLEQELDDTMNRYLERVRDTYEDGNATYLEIILGSESISDFLSRLDRINTMLEFDRNLMNDYKADMEELETKKADLEAQRAAEEEAKTQLEADKGYYDELAAAEAARIEEIEKDKDALAAQQAEYAAAEAEFAEELEAQIAKFQEQQAAQSATVTYVVSGAYVRPIPAGVGYVSQVFGSMTFGKPHRGYDIACAAGTPILACANGTVITAGWHYSWGNYIVVDHGTGYTTLYAHCSALLVSSGQYVTQGQTIGLVGSTGNSTGPHLHLECAYHGSLVDGAAAGIPIYG